MPIGFFIHYTRSTRPRGGLPIAVVVTLRKANAWAGDSVVTGPCSRMILKKKKKAKKKKKPNDGSSPLRQLRWSPSHTFFVCGEAGGTMVRDRGLGPAGRHCAHLKFSRCCLSESRKRAAAPRSTKQSVFCAPPAWPIIIWTRETRMLANREGPLPQH